MMLSVLVPAYNEAHTIEAVIRRIAAVPIPKEIVVVDDGSTDGTPGILAELCREPELHLQCFFHNKNQGKGRALQTAIREAKGDVIVIQDADLEYHPEDYPAAFRLIKEGWADAVYGSRFLGPHRVFYFVHYLANKFLTLLTNALFNSTLTDMETGFKMIRADVLKSLEIRSHTFDFEVEVTAKLCKRQSRMYEIPITYTGRTYEEGKKITWMDGVRALVAIFKFRFCD